jgi:GNAT superfamily N-acetyltransferase
MTATAPPDLELRTLADDEVDAVYPLQVACSAELEAAYGPGHWAWTPPLEWRRQDSLGKRVFAACIAGEPVGTFTLATRPMPFYDLRLFREPGAPAAYLTWMAVDPRHQRSGVGRWCMRQAEAIAAGWRCRALRLDAYDCPAGAGPFYRRCGYRQAARLQCRGVGLILFEKTFAQARGWGGR